VYISLLNRDQLSKLTSYSALKVRTMHKLLYLHTYVPSTLSQTKRQPNYIYGTGVGIAVGTAVGTGVAGGLHKNPVLCLACSALKLISTVNLSV